MKKIIIPILCLMFAQCAFAQGGFSLHGINNNTPRGSAVKAEAERQKKMKEEQERKRKLQNAEISKKKSEVFETSSFDDIDEFEYYLIKTAGTAVIKKHIDANTSRKEAVKEKLERENNYLYIAEIFYKDDPVYKKIVESGHTEILPVYLTNTGAFEKYAVEHNMQDVIAEYVKYNESCIGDMCRLLASSEKYHLIAEAFGGSYTKKYANNFKALKTPYDMVKELDSRVYDRELNKTKDVLADSLRKLYDKQEEARVEEAGKEAVKNIRISPCGDRDFSTYAKMHILYYPLLKLGINIRPDFVKSYEFKKRFAVSTNPFSVKITLTTGQEAEVYVFYGSCYSSVDTNYYIKKIIITSSNGAVRTYKYEDRALGGNAY
ncbi:hypothetical protein Dip518_000214 [Parelusimicrobium proximum]|uniref:hypothetical protein n=1 Tax=Parelusimicrobium proximum TaxID=3228953 RepID=UPI003D16DB1B